jgi:hypothetical protein
MAAPERFADKSDSSCTAGAVHTWPLTSFTALQKGGRYRINSGQTAPSGLTGSAAFDPQETDIGRLPSVEFFTFRLRKYAIRRGHP